MRLGELAGDGASSSSAPRPARLHRGIAISPDLLAIAQCDPTTAPQTLGCTETGLDEAAAAVRLKRFGANRVAQEQRYGIFYELVNRTRNPLNGLLLTLSVLSYFLGDARAAVIIASMVILSIVTALSRSTVPTRPLQAACPRENHRKREAAGRRIACLEDRRLYRDTDGGNCSRRRRRTLGRRHDPR